MDLPSVSGLRVDLGHLGVRKSSAERDDEGKDDSGPLYASKRANRVRREEGGRGGGEEEGEEEAPH